MLQRMKTVHSRCDRSYTEGFEPHDEQRRRLLHPVAASGERDF